MIHTLLGLSPLPDWLFWLWWLLVYGVLSFLTLAVLLIIIAFLLLMDRKVWAAVQLRRGPNVVGPFGLLQSFADLLKFVLKEPLIPAGADKGVFLLAPLATATCALAAWAVIPVSEGSFFGLTTGSMNLQTIVEKQAGGFWNWNVFGGGLKNILIAPVMIGMSVVFFISALAETNRPPFDLPEAESELVAGFMVEYSSTPYLLFMLGEYVAIVTMCALTTILFLGGWLPLINVAPFTWVPGVVWFLLKGVFVFFMFAMVKAIVPRYRYDQLMRLGWKIFLPLSLAMVVIVAGVLQSGVLAR